MKAKLYKVIGRQLGVKEVKSSSHLVDDLGADSIDLVELVMAIEDEFEIEIKDNVIETFLRVSDLENYLVRLGKMDQPAPMFCINQNIRHLKTQNIYQIKGTPAHYRLEAGNEPAYAYLDATTDTVWVRSQTEMEDGRFEAYNV